MKRGAGQDTVRECGGELEGIWWGQGVWIWKGLALPGAAGLVACCPVIETTDSFFVRLGYVRPGHAATHPVAVLVP